MKNIIGTSNRILEVNLTDQSFTKINVPEKDVRICMGGKGMGLKLKTSIRNLILQYKYLFRGLVSKEYLLAFLFF